MGAIRRTAVRGVIAIAVTLAWVVLAFAEAAPPTAGL